jgi:hypothetical protein
MREHQPKDLEIECEPVDTADYEKVFEQTQA